MRTFLAITTVLVVALGFFLVFTPVSAQDPGQTYTLQTPFPEQGPTVAGPADYLRRFYVFGMGFVALLAMARIVYGAIKWTASGGNPAAITSAKDTITQSLWGIGLLAGAYLILYTINPNLVRLGTLEQSISKRLEPLKLNNIGLKFNINLDAEIKQLRLDNALKTKLASELLAQKEELSKEISSIEDAINKETNPVERHQLEIKLAEAQVNKQGVLIATSENEIEINRRNVQAEQLELLKIAGPALDDLSASGRLSQDLQFQIDNAISIMEREGGETKITVEGGFFKIDGVDQEFAAPKSAIDKQTAINKISASTNNLEQKLQGERAELAGLQQNLDNLQSRDIKLEVREVKLGE